MPSHVDLSVLWVPIMPETSKLGEQMEQVGKDATESFGKGSSSLGDKIHESVTKSRDKIRDVFHRTGSDAGKTMSDAFKEETKAVEDIAGDASEKVKGKFSESAKGWGKVLVDAIGPDTKKLIGDRLEETVGGALEGVLGDNAKWVGKFSHTVADWGFDELKTKLGSVKDAADTTKAAFVAFKGGDVQGGVSNLVDSFGKLGIEAKDLPGPIGDAVTKLSEAKATAQGFADIFKDLPGKIGAVGTAIEGLAGPLAVALQSSKDMDAYISSHGHPELVDPSIKGDQYSNTLQSELQQLAAQGYKPGSKVSPPPKLPGVDMSGVTGIGKGGDVLGSNQDAYDAFSSGQPLPNSDNSPAPAPAAPTPSPAANIPSSFVGSAPSASSPSDLHASGSRIANLYKVAESLQGTPYSQALRNDCSGMVSKLATAALGMQPSAQFSTVNEGDWLMSHGFQPGIGPPGSLQIGWYDHGGGNAGHTAATLPNGMNAESGGAHGDFRVGAGAAGANDPQFTQHAWLPMDGSGQKSPLGSQNDPLFVSAAEKGGGAGGGSPWESEGQQLGQGLLGGIAQSVGLDGSVFKTFSGASNPMDFGITKIGTGLLNWGAGMLGAVHQKNTQTPHVSNPTYNVDQSFNLTQHGVEGNGETPYKAAMNSSNRTAALAANMPGR